MYYTSKCIIATLYQGILSLISNLNQIIDYLCDKRNINILIYIYINI